MALVVGVVEIETACSATRCLFCSNDFPRRIVLLAVIHVVLQDIVEAYHIESLDHFATTGIGNRRVACGVEQFGIFPHGSCYACSLNRILDAPFLVAVAPQDDGGVVAVALDHTLQQSEVLLVDTSQSVFVNHQYSLSVADVEQGRCHGVM